MLVFFSINYGLSIGQDRTLVWFARKSKVLEANGSDMFLLVTNNYLKKMLVVR